MREIPLYRRVDLYEVREGVVDLRPRPRHARLYVCAAIAALAAALWLLWPAHAGAVESEAVVITPAFKETKHAPQKD